MRTSATPVLHLICADPGSGNEVPLKVGALQKKKRCYADYKVLVEFKSRLQSRWSDVPVLSNLTLHHVLDAVAYPRD